MTNQTSLSKPEPHRSTEGKSNHGSAKTRVDLLPHHDDICSILVGSNVQALKNSMDDKRFHSNSFFGGTSSFATEAEVIIF